MQMPGRVMVYAMGLTILLNQLCQEIQFEETINQMLNWDQEKCHLSPGTRIKALVLNILSSHTSLYRFENFYAKQNLSMLFADTVQADDFNDDALARALDKLHEVGAWNVYST